ncbi:hypothetical protein [Streptomyces europaeiscabiei]|uniref:hypothetical protein n=1 Tax=Streptomyces europaeiscabiei TaxID=146819 RepID=UPI0029B16BAC|nr:hypothetical protein [Streptomyces europaeiscabiei]MDX2525185.1 hypothetical protein [Streptomyces europaeiscabiei]
MGNSGNGPAGKPPVKAEDKRSKAAKRLSRQQEELRRLRVLQELAFARDAERRRNGLGAAPVRTEKPSSPAATRSGKPTGKRKKRASPAAPANARKPSSTAVPGLMESPGAKRKKKARAASYKEFPASRPVPVADRGVDRQRSLPNIALAYMRLTPEEAQRERRIKLAREKNWEREAVRKLAKKEAQSAGKSGAGRRTKAQGTKPRAIR